MTLTLLFLSSLFVAQLMSSFNTSRVLLQMFRRDSDRQERLRERIRESEPDRPGRSGSVPASSAGSH